MFTSGCVQFYRVIFLATIFQVNLGLFITDDQKWIGLFLNYMQQYETGMHEASNGAFMRAAGYYFFGPEVQPDPDTAISVPVKSKLKLVPIDDLQHYLHFATASCFSNKILSSFSCNECNLAGRHVKVLGIVVNSTLDTLGYVALDSKRQEIVVTFRGTQGPTNFHTDVRTTMMMSPLGDGAGLHSGFYDATMSLYTNISYVIKTAIARYPNYTIVFTGHSLGGCMGTLTYYFLSQEMPNLSYKLVTFGEPRSGDRRFADIINSREIYSARVVNMNDFGPHSIPWSQGYVHHQTEYWIINRKIRVCSNKNYEDLSCSASLPVKKLRLTDHLAYLGSSFGLNCVVADPIGSFYGVLQS